MSEGLFAGNRELRRLDFGSFVPAMPRARFRGPSAASARKARTNGIQHNRMIRAGLRGLQVLDAIMATRQELTQAQERKKR